MLNSLLDINQIESGVMEVSPAQFAVGEPSDRLRAEFEPLAQSQAISLRVIPSSAMLLSDPRLIEVMLRNLLAHAVTYTPAGGRILMGFRQHGAMVRIEVKDTGIGIAGGQLAPIFDEFHQVDNPAHERERGFGLGLTIVRELGQLLGHEVTVQSSPGKGSVFSVLVPRGSLDADEAGNAASPVSSSDAAASGGCTIALIEDDPDVRAVLEAMLSESGHIVISARDGPAALALASEGAILPDLVLTDYNLPGGLNGIEVLAGLRKQLKREVPCIVLTGDIAIAALAAIDLADCLLLNKPVTAAELHAAIRKVMPQGCSVRSADTPQPSRLICVLEDNPEWRNAVRSVLEYENWPATTYPDAEAFQAAEDASVDHCLIIGTNLPGMSGMALIEHLRANGDSVPAILITRTGDIAMAVQAMRSGASDFIERPVSRRDLLGSIERALSQRLSSLGRGADTDAFQSRMAALTPRQKAVLDLVIAGQPSKNITADLGISQRTVESHRAHIMRRMGVRTIPDLVRAVVAASPG